MKSLQKGIELQLDHLILEYDTAIAHRSGTVNVFATPAMIALMEETAMKSVEPFIDSAKTTVGFEIKVKHFKAIKPGNTVNCFSLLEGINDRKLVFVVNVMCKDELVGTGMHTRYIVDKSDF